MCGVGGMGEILVGWAVGTNGYGVGGGGGGLVGWKMVG